MEWSSMVLAVFGTLLPLFDADSLFLSETAIRDSHKPTPAQTSGHWVPVLICGR
jgi:hypothetical protein